MASTTTPIYGGVLKQSTAATVKVLARQTDHVSPATGIATGDWTTKRLAKGGAAAWAGITPTVSEDEDGFYQVPLTSSHTDTVGKLYLKLQAAGVDDVNYWYDVVAATTDDISSSLPAAVWDYDMTAYGIGDSAGNLAAATFNEAVNNTTGIAAVSSAVQIAAGTAQAGGSSTIRLANTSSSTNDLYNGLAVKISSGAGAGQARVITAYNGTTKDATVHRAWTTAPDNTSVYRVLTAPSGVVPGDVADAVLDEAVADHVTSGSLGEYLRDALGLMHKNVLIDNTTNTLEGLTAARVRIFADAATCAAATIDAAGLESAVASFTVESTYDGVGKLASYRMVKD